MFIIIFIGYDHTSVTLKENLISFLKENSIEYEDTGSKEYPLAAKCVSEKVLSTPSSKGILMCGTGIGISISANKYKGIRCALCSDSFSAKKSREHNDANILAMGSRVVGNGIAVEILEAFLKTEFSLEERHVNRISLIEKL